MFGKVSDERSVGVPASEAWKLYGSLQLSKLVEQSMPTLISKLDVVEGDGGVGTILEIFFVPGIEGGFTFTSYKEKFTVVDDEKRVKEAEVVEGGYLDVGFTLYRVRLEVIEKEGKEEECITRVTVEYEVNEDAPAKPAVDSIQIFTAIMQIAADHLQRNYSSSSNS